jgi:hypothetical protein
MNGHSTDRPKIVDNMFDPLHVCPLSAMLRRANAPTMEPS